MNCDKIRKNRVSFSKGGGVALERGSCGGRMGILICCPVYFACGGFDSFNER